MSPLIPVPETPSEQERAIQQIVEALEEAAGAEGPKIHRRRHRPFNRDDLDHGAVVVYPLQEVGENDTHDWTRDDELRFRTEIRARQLATVEEAIDTELDRLFAWLVLAMHVDPSFGGVIHGLERRERSWDVVEIEEVYGGLGVDWTCTLFTRADDAGEVA